MSIKFAVLSSSNEVENVLIAETIEIAVSVSGKSCIEIPEDAIPLIGDSWDGTTFIPKPSTSIASTYEG
jgi:hypothetical protein